MIDKKPQIEKFKEAAREHECDESEAAFSEKLKKLVEHQPEKETD